MGRFGCQSLRELFETIRERVRCAVIHAPDGVGETRDGRVALCHRLERERPIVVVLHLVEARFEIEILVLEGVRQLMRQ